MRRLLRALSLSLSLSRSLSLSPRVCLEKGAKEGGSKLRCRVVRSRRAVSRESLLRGAFPATRERERQKGTRIFLAAAPARSESGGNIKVLRTETWRRVPASVPDGEVAKTRRKRQIKSKASRGKIPQPAHGASLIFLRTEVCYTKPASSPLDGNKHEAEAEAEAEAESGSGSGGGGGTETDSDSEVPEQRKQDNDEDKDSK
ncbi:uncharacterized protein LOC6600500 [Drosophila persimilis]|uniref:uncharacterized protein LOC6600500 n=1 Tax=Drosophila persimilis TaxID=7234 RepID=UPI000F092DEF|nr:uncharacterized protein LOC6600500 [Drosophila persimilis]